MAADSTKDPKAATITTAPAATATHAGIAESVQPVDGPRIQLYTSLSAGSSSAVTAQLRIETILKAQRIKYEIVDLATDEKAKKVWTRRGKGRKLPGVVRVTEEEHTIVGGLDELEEANEYGELKELVLKGGD